MTTYGAVVGGSNEGTNVLDYQRTFNALDTISALPGMQLKWCQFSYGNPSADNIVQQIETALNELGADKIKALVVGHTLDILNHDASYITNKLATIWSKLINIPYVVLIEYPNINNIKIHIDNRPQAQKHINDYNTTIRQWAKAQANVMTANYAGYTVTADKIHADEKTVYGMAMTIYRAMLLRGF